MRPCGPLLRGWLRGAALFQTKKRPFKQGRSRPVRAPLKRSFLCS
nr:MAG TPA: hypothetical protein [Caudoviricetes sp.]DAX71150.1 MAG TPA: hypothetical protein [Caudoviricetes sp.]